MTQVLCVVGARPNFMKIAPVMAALAEAGLRAKLLHTGQHYDEAMNERFFQDLGIAAPDFHLEVGSASHAVQTAEVMKRFEPIVEAEAPRSILVVGDINSTIACALVGTKLGVQVIHVEAGLRSYDRAMPEEVNRVLTDQISDLLFTTERSALDNLRKEGIAESRVHFVGNVMIDTLRRNLDRAVAPTKTLAGHAGPYAILTLHRPSNVDDKAILEKLLRSVAEINQRIPVVFPLHPRTLARIDSFSLGGLIENLKLMPPLGYLEMLGLMQGARFVMTDSGGIQEETTALGVPCLTLRENTERPVTINEGTNTLIGTDMNRLRQAVDEIFSFGGKAGRVPEYWDGKAAVRIAEVIRLWLPGGQEARVA
ncbi:MAG: UDP-N-acetylglucosamine 2-epimerase (non-hydrolyzing) [Thiobacillaceae bacterium]